ncbi:MAG: PD-(D/E)XK nuclease family protein [Anaeromyxobacter sp.]
MSLLGCPLQWLLQYGAGLRPGRALQLPEGSQLLGTFVHALLQDLVHGPRALPLAGLSEADAQAHVERAFDARVAGEAAPLVQRGQELALDRARRLAGGAAAALVRHLHAGDWEVVGVETPLAGEFAGHPVEGYADLVLRRRKDGARAVLDLKLGRFTYRRKELEQGQGLQLALYARMLGPQGGKLPPAGYLVLQDGELLAHSLHAFPTAVEAQGPSLEETLQIAGRTLALWERALGGGHVPVAIEKSDWAERIAEVVGEVPGRKDPGRYPPRCDFCQFSVLCEVSVGQSEVEP